MARTMYAGRPGDTVLSRFLMGDGRILVGVPATAGGTPAATTLTVWDEPDGIMLTDLLAADGVTPITELVVPAGEIQIPAFYGPDGVTGDLWLKDPDGDYSRLDIGPQGPAGPPGADGTGTVSSVNGVAPVAGNVTLGASDVGAQPSDSDLTAIAALTTTTYGRAFLALADAAAARTALALGTAATKNTGTSAGEVPVLAAAPGTPDGTKFLRDDGTWAAAGGGGPLTTPVKYAPATAVTKTTTTTTPVDVDATNLVTTFTAPASGRVVVILSASSKTTGGAFMSFWCLRSGTTNVPGSEVQISEVSSVTTRYVARIIVSDLTPGTSYTYKWGYRVQSGGTAAINAGSAEFSGATPGPATMEVYAA